jgi:hypothetical protein
VIQRIELVKVAVPTDRRTRAAIPRLLEVIEPNPFLKALSDDFDANGIAVIESVRNDRPHEYLKIVAAVQRQLI